MKRKSLTDSVRARVPIEMRRELHRVAFEMMVSPSDVVRHAIRDYIATKPAKRARKEVA